MSAGLSMHWKVSRQRLILKRTFTIARGSSDYRDTIRISLHHEGITGWGEAAPNSRYGESVDIVVDSLAVLHRAGESGDPRDYPAFLLRNLSLLGNCYAARAAVDMAVHDWIGKWNRQPLHRFWEIDPGAMPPTSVTIGIDTPERMACSASESEGYRVLKLKLGTDHDRELVRGVRSVTDTRLRVDANEGWTNKEEALRKIEWLAEQNVELVEQPLPARMAAEARWLRERSPLPLIGDEAILRASDLAAAAEAFHGVNIKLMKCGGLQAALALLKLAKLRGLSVMIGCMVESSCGVAAAAQIAPLADYVDLDSNLLLRHDPFVGHAIEQGVIRLNNLPGLGVTLKGA